jgi:deoxyhypusine synthase
MHLQHYFLWCPRDHSVSIGASHVACLQVDVLVTTAGGVEEDLIKCLAPTFMGSFSMEGTQLRAKGLNRIGNLLVPNTNYCKFEDWVVPILDQLVAEQKQQGTLWTPSRMIARLGKEINHPDSICYWAQKNSIPIYCPAITDGSLGDMIYFHSFRNPGLVIDIVEGKLYSYDVQCGTLLSFW